jgi:hypothetical protein
MKKRLFAAATAALVMLAACGRQSAAPAPDDSISGGELVQSGAEFPFERIEDSVFTMIYEPRSDAVTGVHFGLDMPEGYDTDWTGDAAFDANYTIFDVESSRVLGTVKITTAPPDLAAHYGESDPEEIRNLMLSTFFVTEDVYAGLKKAIVEDFEYDLVLDWTGTAYEWPAFYLEFIDEDAKTRALRFYMCNGEFDEKFYALTINANLPMDDAARLADLRRIIFSLHPRQ